jgi:predicted membrane-bound spermidine synthase
MIVELTTTRLLAPWFGASIYSWTNVIAVVLLALACGYAAGGRLADRRPSARMLGFLLLASAALLVPAPMIARFLAPAVLPKPELTDPASGVSGLVLGSFVTTLVLFAPPLVVLGAVTPFGTRLLADSGLKSGQASGRVLAISTLGSLVGTYLPALVLLESLGSRATILVAAGILAVAGLILCGVKSRAPITAAALIACGLAGAGALFAATPVVPVSHGETLVAEKESAYQYVRVADWPGRNGQPAARNLSIDEGILEFHSRKRVDPRTGAPDPLTGVYYDAFAVLPEWIARSEQEPLRVLVIGGGAGTARGLLRALQAPRVREVADVEIDPVVAGFAPMFGGVASAPDATLVADGRVLLARVAGPFDLIILDAYTRQIAIPPHLASVEAFTRVREQLSARGIFAINVSAADVEAPLPAALAATLREVFGKVWSVSIQGSWSLVMFAGSPLAPSAVPASRGDALDPVRKWFREGFHELPAVPGARILTDDCAPMESLARKIR